MPNKKIVFLFGAGAVLDWGAPRTICNREKLTFIPEHGSDEVKNRVCCLTHLITSTGFYANDGSRITNKIFKTLESKGKKGSTNFETIINVIEDLYAYWASQKNEASNNLFSMLNLDVQSQDLSFFEHSLSNPDTKNYSISIPKSSPLLNEDLVSNEIDPSQKYYEMLLTDLLGGIKGHVSKYSWYTKGHNVIINDTNSVLNNHFSTWMKSFLSDNYSLRMYTLNYDRLFKVLLSESGMEIFEGFELAGTAVDYQQPPIPPNLPRIVSDFTSHVHYNLHGSVSWNIEEYNLNNLPGYQYVLVPFGDIDSPAATIEIEKGTRLLLTTIITGHQKVQKTSISPFRQMFSAFDRDCFEADKLYIVGYSLGDEHINDIIRNSRKYNEKLEIILINPCFDENQFSFDFISHWGRHSGQIYENVGDNELVSADFNVKIIKKRFGEFLSDFNETEN